MSDPDVLWLYLHVPKTGGTTINGHLSRHLAFDDTFVLLNRWGRSYRRREGRLPLEERTPEERARIRCLVGHRVWYGVHELVPGRAPRYVTVLRDPAAQILSRYNFDRSRARTSLPFEAWYAERFGSEHARNPQVRFLADRYAGTDSERDLTQAYFSAVALLRRCWFVGVTAHLDDDLPHLFAAMGVPTTWDDYRRVGSGHRLLGVPGHPRAHDALRRYVTLDNALRERLNADHAADLALVRLAERWRTERAPWRADVAGR